MCASVLLTFSSCTDDSADGTEEVRMHELHLSLSTHQFNMTRAAGDLPDAFVNYDHTEALAKIMQIQCYMAYHGAEAADYVPCVFNYTNESNKDIWTSTVPLKSLTDNKRYYLYGYMPKSNVNGNVSIAPYNNDYKKGAVLTLSDLNAVTPDDVCVIVGAEGYGSGTKPNIPDMSRRLGVFDYYPETDGGNIFLLIDHLYAGLQFNFSLGEKYSQLRSIKIKTIKLIPEDGDKAVIESVTAVVTVVANSLGKNPIVPILSGEGVNTGGSVEYKDKKTGTNPKPAVLFEGEKELTQTAEKFMACFCPATNTKFILETTYDVYDRKGNLIRLNDIARNTIELKRDMNAGQIHIVNITVQPTFLYMLSDPDLDNPTFRIEN